MNAIDRIRESSHYLSTLLRRSEEMSEWLETGKSLYRRYPLTELFQDLQRSGRKAESFEQLLVAFRDFKQRHFLRIGGRDLLGMADLAETTSQLSDLAGVSLQVGLDVLTSHPEWWAGSENIAAWTDLQENVRLVVMGMGKLGGHELNYVSDVDLLFLYALKNEGLSLPPDGSVLLSRLFQRLSRLLSDSVQGDRVFQVDLRLRPQGKDGLLAPSAAAAAEYYLNSGHAWERQALLKARPVAGDRSLGTAFLHEVRPFVFRRFLDFQALDELRAMRDRILAEAVQPGAGWRRFDVKLGIGGIREIEFMVQSLQLIYGGRHPELDEPNTLKCLDRLSELKLLSSEIVEELKGCYSFLRKVEHWIQLDLNRQTQKLPQSEDGMQRLAFALGFGGNEAPFLEKLQACCTGVHGHFTAMFHSERNGGSPDDRYATAGEWAEEEPSSLESFPPEALSRMSAHLEAFPSLLQQTVSTVLRGHAHIRSAELREKIPLKLERYFSQVRKRPGLMRLFRTDGSWMSDFCLGLVRSELLSDLLSHNPSLVEGIATASSTCPDIESWESCSVRLIERTQSYEEGLEWIRRLKNERLLQLALADLQGDFSHEILEVQLTALADFVIRATYERVLKHLGLSDDLPLSILGLGKLGSREMSYLSDLDLVFVYQPQPGEPEGEIPQDVVRLIQRLMRMLSTPLHEGPGYEVDARLRPTGNYGPLIVTRRSWLEYYLDQADLWEIQALLRVRAVGGSPELGRWIEQQAAEICYRRRDGGQVWGRLCHLRGRMQRERANESDEALDIKLGMGGLADLEFFVQGHLLVEGYKDPELRSPSVRAGLPRALEDLPERARPPYDIVDAFRALRSLEHRLRLFTNQTSPRTTPALLEAMQSLSIWPPAQGRSRIEDWQDLQLVRRNVRAFFRNFCPEL